MGVGLVPLAEGVAGGCTMAGWRGWGFGRRTTAAASTRISAASEPASSLRVSVQKGAFTGSGTASGAGTGAGVGTGATLICISGGTGSSSATVAAI